MFTSVCKNRALRRIFGPKWEEMAEWRKLHEEGLQNLYSSSNIITNQIKENEVGMWDIQNSGWKTRVEETIWEI
jgi:hypothetical protein